MSTEEEEQLRTSIWDQLYVAGPQSIGQLAEALESTDEAITASVDHSWFLLREDTVEIATNEQ